MWRILALLVWGVAASAEPPGLTIAGEIAPDYQGIDRAVMRGYAQDRITHITFHHEGFAGADAALFARASAARDRQTITQRVLNIHHDHVANAGLGMIAYHYVIDKTGQIARGRPVAYAPATRSTVKGGTARADFTGHFAVMALGDFNHEHLTDAARLSYIRVMSQAQRAFRVPTAHIRPHLDYAATACPGAHIMAEADSLPQQVLAYSLQVELAARGCTDAPPDGQWGAASRKALTRLAAQDAALAVADPGDAALFGMIDNPGLWCQQP